MAAQVNREDDELQPTTEAEEETVRPPDQGEPGWGEQDNHVRRREQPRVEPNLPAVDVLDIAAESHFDTFPAFSKLITKCFRMKVSNLWIALFFTTVLLLQIYFVVKDSYEGFGRISEHSKCRCNGFATFVMASLRGLTRVVFSASLFACLYVNMLKGRQPSPPHLVFLKQISQHHNKRILVEFVKRYLDPECNDDDPAVVHLANIHRYMYDQLKWFCLTSVLQAIVLVVSLAAFPYTDISSNWVIGIVDLLSYGVLLALCGTILSLELLDGYIRQYFNIFQTFSNCKRLRQRARAVDEWISGRWYPMNRYNEVMCLVYCILLIISWASGIPLSCGFSISVKAIMEEEAYSYWLMFMGIVIVCQIIGANPYRYQVRILSVVVEVVALVLLRLFSPTYEWSSFFQTLYALYPLSYLFWTYILSIQRQWTGTGISRQSSADNRNHNHHWCRIFTRGAFVFLIVSSLSASLYTEYHHIKPSAIGMFATPMKSGEFTMKQYEDYDFLEAMKFLKKQNSDLQPPGSQYLCVYFNTEVLEDDQD